MARLTVVIKPSEEPKYEEILSFYKSKWWLPKLQKIKFMSDFLKDKLTKSDLLKLFRNNIESSQQYGGGGWEWLMIGGALFVLCLLLRCLYDLHKSRKQNLRVDNYSPDNRNPVIAEAYPVPHGHHNSDTTVVQVVGNIPQQSRQATLLARPLSANSGGRIGVDGTVIAADAEAGADRSGVEGTVIADDAEAGADRSRERRSP